MQLSVLTTGIRVCGVVTLVVLDPASNSILFGQRDQLVVMREQLCRGFRDQYVQLVLNSVFSDRVVSA